MAFADDPRFAAAVDKHGGPQGFTLDFVRHVRTKGEDKLTPMEKSAWDAIKKFGVDGFTRRVQAKFPEAKEGLPGGGPTGGGVSGFLERAGEGLVTGLETAAAVPATIGRGIEKLAEPQHPEVEPGIVERAGTDVLAAASGMLQAPQEILRQVREGKLGEAGLTAIGATGFEATGEAIGEKGFAATLKEHPVLTPLTLGAPFLIGLSVLKPKAVAGETARLRAGRPTLSPDFIELAKTVPLDAAELQRRLAQTQPLPGLATTQQFPAVTAAEVPQELIDARLAETQPFDVVPAGGRAIPRRFRPQPPETGFEIVPDFESLGATALDLHNKTGGSTVNIEGGNMVGKPATSVSIYPERTVSVEGKTITPEQVASFVTKNKDLLADPRHSLGTFFDEKTGKTDLDVVVTVPHETALRLGRAANQKSVFRLDTFETVETGGTGEAVSLGPETGRLDRLSRSTEPRPASITLGEDKVVPQETPGGGAFLEQHHEVTLPPETPVREIAYEPAYEIGGPQAVEFYSNPLVRASSAASNSTLGAVLWEFAADIKNTLQKTFEAGTTKPGTFALAKTRPGEAAILQRYAASEGAARVTAIIQHRRLANILGSEKLIRQFWEVMNDGQIRAIAERERAAGRTPFRESLLSDAERAKIIANPQVAEARAFWKKHVQPEVERLAPQAMVDHFRYDVDGLYSPLNWLKEIEPGKWVDRYNQPQGAINRRSFTTERKGGRIFTRRTARAAKRAAGTADRYSVDSLHNFVNMYRDRFGAADQNAVIDMLKAHSVEVSKGSPPPEGHIFAGDTLPNLAVPKDIGLEYQRIRDLKVQGEAVGVMGLGRNWLTRVSLWGPFDAFSTFLRSVGAVYRLPQLTGDATIITKLTAVTKSLPEMARIIAKAANIHGAEATIRLKNLARHGALRVTPFLETETAGTAFNMLKKTAFALPEFERGAFGGRSLIGYDTRFRVMYDGLLEQLGVKDIAQRAAILNNEMGTYVRALQPSLVRSLAHIDPFAVSHVAALKSQVKAVGGISPATNRVSPEVLWSTVGSMIATPIVLNYVVNGKMPWQIPDLRPGDVRFTHNGKNYDISYRMLLGPVARAYRATGMRDALDAVWNGSGRWEDVATSGIIGAGNELSLFVGPAIQAGWTLVSGRGAFIEPRTGEMIKLAQESMHPLRENLKAVSGSLLQLLPPDTGTETPDSMTERLLQGIGQFGQQVAGIRQRGTTEQLAGGIAGRAKARRYRIAQAVAMRARKTRDEAHAADRPFSAHDAIAQDLTDRGLEPGTKDFRVAQRTAIRLYRVRGKSIRRNVSEARRMREEQIQSDDEAIK